MIHYVLWCCLSTDFTDGQVNNRGGPAQNPTWNTEAVRINLPQRTIWGNDHRTKKNDPSNLGVLRSSIVVGILAGLVESGSPWTEFPIFPPSQGLAQVEEARIGLKKMVLALAGFSPWHECDSHTSWKDALRRRVPNDMTWFGTCHQAPKKCPKFLAHEMSSSQYHRTDSNRTPSSNNFDQNFTSYCTAAKLDQLDIPKSLVRLRSAFWDTKNRVCHSRRWVSSRSSLLVFGILRDVHIFMTFHDCLSNVMLLLFFFVMKNTATNRMADRCSAWLFR